MTTITNKPYVCAQCGHVTFKKTNHHGFIYNIQCPKCDNHLKWLCADTHVVSIRYLVSKFFNVEFDRASTDLLILPMDQAQVQEICSFLTKIECYCSVETSTVEGQDWYGMQYVEIPFLADDLTMGVELLNQAWGFMIENESFNGANVLPEVLYKLTGKWISGDTGKESKGLFHTQLDMLGYISKAKVILDV